MKIEMIFYLFGTLLFLQLASAQETVGEKCAKLGGCMCDDVGGCFVFPKDKIVHEYQEAKDFCASLGCELPTFEHERAVNVRTCCKEKVYMQPYWLFGRVDSNSGSNCSSIIVKQIKQYEVTSQCLFENDVRVVCEIPYTNSP